MENERKFIPKQDGTLRPSIEICSKINEFLRSQIIPQFEERQARAKIFSEELVAKIHSGQKITQEDLDAFKKINDSVIAELIDLVYKMGDFFSQKVIFY